MAAVLDGTPNAMYLNVSELQSGVESNVHAAIAAGFTAQGFDNTASNV